MWNKLKNVSSQYIGEPVVRYLPVARNSNFSSALTLKSHPMCQGLFSNNKGPELGIEDQPSLGAYMLWVLSSLTVKSEVC